MNLRDYQKHAIELLRKSLQAGHRTPLLKLPTGSGKTVIAGEIIKKALEKGKKVAFIVDRITLVNQASEHLDSVGIDHGIIQANHWRKDHTKDVQVISVQTMARRKLWPFNLGIIDEAHILFKHHKELISRWDNIPFIGMSATPHTQGLGLVYDDLICPVTIRELIEQGYLVNADIYGPSQPDMSGVKTVAGDYNKKEMSERTNKPKLIANIVDTWLKMAKGKQTICFACDIAHSKFIAEEFQNAGVNAVHIDAYTDSKERKEYIDDFKNNKITLLTSVGVLTTGFDAPNAEVGILARPTKSLSLHIQMIGRLLRICEGKENALILDHAGNIERLGFHTDPTPDYLDIGEKGKSKSTDPLPKACPQCHFLRPPRINKCPQCGFEAIKENKIYEKEGSLEKLLPADNYEEYIFYRELLGYAKKHKMKSGWAYYAFKDKYDKNPTFTGEPLPPSEETNNYAKHLLIKYRKGTKRLPDKRNPVMSCQHCGSKLLSKTPGKGPHYAGIKCDKCNKHLGWLPKPENNDRPQA